MPYKKNKVKQLTCKLHNRNKTKKNKVITLVRFVAPTGIEPVFHA